LDELGVQAALEGLIERASCQGLEIDLSVDLAHEQGRQPTPLLSELETALYRIVQEGLTNAQKHGRAKRAVVELREDETVVYLSLRDDGAGFDPDVETEGFGLVGIRERVELLGGHLGVDSAPGSGTVLSISFPAQRSPQRRPASIAQDAKPTHQVAEP
jgi:signal transduction histidine kinase